MKSEVEFCNLKGEKQEQHSRIMTGEKEMYKSHLVD